MCAGTFDPITNGHLDVIARAAPECDELLVAVVARARHKGTGLFDTEARVGLARQATAHLSNVRVLPFAGLLVEFARAHEATCLVRGLRTVTDFEYELGIAQLNRMLDEGIKTLYMPTDPAWSFCSSSAVRELHAYGGDLSRLVPGCVADALDALRER